MVVVFTGKNSYALTKAFSDYVSSFESSYGSSIERFDATELQTTDDVLNAVRSISFLDPKKMVVVRNFAQSKDMLEVLEEIIHQTPDSCELVLLDQKLDRRTSYFKFLQKNTTIKDYGPINSHELISWLAEECGRLGANADRRTLQYLVERVGEDQQTVANELQKLVSYNTTISRASIDALTDMAPQSNVFLLLDALFQGDSSTAWRLYLEQRAQGEDPHKIMAMVTWQLQQLVYAVFSPQGDVVTLVEAGMSRFSAQKSLQTARRIDRDALKYYISALLQLDLLTKKSADAESALAVYFSDIALSQKA